MIEPSRKGWCPTLESPMATGDGLLARLYPRHGVLTPASLKLLADAAALHGNGLIEITSRGNIQVRGLRNETVAPFGEAVIAAGVEVEPAPEIRIPAFAERRLENGSVLAEVADRIRAEFERRGLASRLSAKFAVVVTSDDYAELDTLTSDLSLTLGHDSAWQLAVAGDRQTARCLGAGSLDDVLAVAFEICEQVAALGSRSRVKYLGDNTLRGLAGQLKSQPPTVSVHQDRDQPLRLGLALGLVTAPDLIAFCDTLPDQAELCVAPDRTLLVAGLGTDEMPAVHVAVERSGLIADARDPRLSVFACAGAPACAAARLATRELGASLAPDLADLLCETPLYIAGCSKQCARPSGRHVAITGTDDGIAFDFEAAGIAQDARAWLERLVRERVAS